MDEPTLLGERELSFLSELNARGVRYLVVGLSAAALQGAPVVTQDIDLWFRDLSDPRLAEALCAAGGVYVPPDGISPPVFAGVGLGLLDIVMTMHGLGSFDDECDATMTIPIGSCDVPVLRLDRIIASKRAAGRQKDQRVLDILEDVWRTLQHRGSTED